jgi:hypothetical protein
MEFRRSVAASLGYALAGVATVNGTSPVPESQEDDDGR